MKVGEYNDDKNSSVRYPSTFLLNAALLPIKFDSDNFLAVMSRNCLESQLLAWVLGKAGFDVGRTLPWKKKCSAEFFLIIWGGVFLHRC